MFNEIDGMVKKNFFGNLEISGQDWSKVSELAKKGIASVGTISTLQNQLTEANKGSEIYKRHWQDLSVETEDYRKAKELSPAEVKSSLDEIIQKGKQTPETPHKPRNKDRGTER